MSDFHEAAAGDQQVETGNRILDRILDGGLPRNHAVLLTGGPGTGKSTLAMQFLQAGLESDEECLFISTEQTYHDLATSFAGFDFSLDHENLQITTVHAGPGHTFEGGDEETLTLKTLEGGELLGDDHSVPFTGEYLLQHLDRYGPADRVVLDSVSGVASMAETTELYRRSVLDLIHLFTDGFGATTLLTAEQTGPQPGHPRASGEAAAAADAIQFNAHGVIKIWREMIKGDYQRFLEVTKMRGVDHDTRSYVIEFTERGIRLLPRLRHHPTEFVPDSFIPTGIENLDVLLGGGIVSGGSALLQHDGQAIPHSLLVSSLSKAIQRDMALLFVPSVELPPKALTEVFEERIGPMRELMDEDRLFLIDLVNVWENSHRNVFKPQASNGSFDDIYEAVDQRRDGRPLFSLINVESQLPSLEPDQIRRNRFWEEENFYREQDTAIYWYNPASIPSSLDAFFMNGATQILSTWLTERGIQFLKVKKSPSGYMGLTRAIEYIDEDPYLRIQQTPGGRDLEGSGAGDE